MVWIKYDTITKGILSAHPTEPTTGAGESKVQGDFEVLYGYMDYLWSWKYSSESSSVVRNTGVWIIYQTATGTAISAHSSEPTTGVGESKIQIDHVFNLSQPIYFVRVDPEDGPEPNTQAGAEAREIELGIEPIEEGVGKDRKYVYFNYPKTTSSDNKIMFGSGGTRNTMGSSGNYDSNNIIPEPIPKPCTIKKIYIRVAGAAVSGDSQDANIDVDFCLNETNASGSGEVQHDISVPIISANWNIGNWYNSSVDADINVSSDLDISISSPMSLLGLQWIRNTGSDGIAEIRNLYVVLEVEMNND